MNIYGKILDMAESNPNVCIVINISDYVELLKTKKWREIKPVTLRTVLQKGLYATIPRYKVGIVVRKNAIPGHYNLETPSSEIENHISIECASE